MTSTALAMVQYGVRDLRAERFPLPEIGADDALLRVEACGICGSDYEQYDGTLRVRYPLIPGHEPVGIIERISDVASQRWRVSQGDRVAVETLLPCGHCASCAQGEYRFCSGGGGFSAYGYKPVSMAPSLWGGYAEYLYLDAHSLVHRVSKDVAPEIATLYNPVGAGYRWAVDMPALRVGETIVILGPGQRGLACVIAAREAGAGRIIITGLLPQDEAKFALAKEFGADHTIDAASDDPARVVRELTDGAMADVVIDVTAYAVEAVTQAVDIARRGGRIILAGTKGARSVPEFFSDRVVMKELTVRGALGVDWRAYEAAVLLIESRKYPLDKMHTHTLPLAEAERGFELLAGRIDGEQAVHIALVP